MEVDIDTSIGNVLLKTPIYNASGVYCTTYDDITLLNDSNSCGAIVSKSCTLNYRKGNKEPRYADTFDGFSRYIVIRKSIFKV